MESMQTDDEHPSILASPVKSTNTLPAPSWNVPVQSSYSRTSATSSSNRSLCDITVLTPGGSNDPHSTNITLQNCVATMDVGCELNLILINARTRNSEYNPSRFNGVIMKIRNPRTTALIFRSGKIVCTGARHEHDALLASKKFARILQKLGFNIRICGFQVQNFVATCDLRFPIKLENMHQIHGQFSRYEPEVFPGLIYRLIKPRLVLLIFVNGKIVFTGAKSRQDLKDALDTMYPILRSFRKN